LGFRALQGYCGAFLLEKHDGFYWGFREGTQMSESVSCEKILQGFDG